MIQTCNEQRSAAHRRDVHHLHAAQQHAGGVGRRELQVGGDARRGAGGVCRVHAPIELFQLLQFKAAAAGRGCSGQAGTRRPAAAPAGPERARAAGASAALPRAGNPAAPTSTSCGDGCLAVAAIHRRPRWSVAHPRPSIRLIPYTNRLETEQEGRSAQGRRVCEKEQRCTPRLAGAAGWRHRAAAPAPGPRLVHGHALAAVHGAHCPGWAPLRHAG